MRRSLWVAALIGVWVDCAVSFALILISFAFRWTHGADVPVGAVVSAALNVPGLMLASLLPLSRSDEMLGMIVGVSISGALYGVVVELIRRRVATLKRGPEAKG
jgi:hypothetical protein